MWLAPKGELPDVEREFMRAKGKTKRSGSKRTNLTRPCGFGSHNLAHFKNGLGSVDHTVRRLSILRRPDLTQPDPFTCNQRA